MSRACGGGGRILAVSGVAVLSFLASAVPAAAHETRRITFL